MGSTLTKRCREFGQSSSSSSATGLPVANQVMTTGDWLAWWSAEVLPRTVKPKTVDSYRWVLGAYVIPHVGTVPLVQLEGLTPGTSQVRIM